MEVQIFGTNKSASTRKALRFFSERRIKAHFVDLTVRAASRGELTRFVQKFGAGALLDRHSKRFAERGLQTAIYSDDRWVFEFTEDPGLLLLPLVRNGKFLTVGDREEEWKEWVRQNSAGSAQRS